MGELIDRLRTMGASIVALDIVFAEADRYADSVSVTDAALAKTLRAGGVVLGYAFTFDGSASRASACLQRPLGLAVVQRGPDHAAGPFFTATGAVCNLPVLTDAAGAAGFMNAAPDPDGILRRVPLLVEFQGGVYPGLALAAVTAATGARDLTLEVANVNTARLLLSNGADRSLGDRSIPLDGKSNLLLRYRGPKRTFPYVSAADVMSGAADARMFAGKIVFVGTTALGTREVVATPLDTLFAGVEVQATVADNLLQRDYLHRPEHAVALETQLVLGLGLFAAIVTGQLGLAWGALGVSVCLVSLWIVAISLMSHGGLFLSPLYPSLGLTGGLAAMTAAGFAVERRRADVAGRERTTSQRLMIQTLLSLTEVRDAETGRHSRRTQEYARILAEQLALDPAYRSYLTPERIALFSTLAPLHDIGKVGVPDRLLHKPGMLTADELVEMRKHPAHGRDVIEQAEREVGVHDDVTLAMAKDIVYTHHEKWDGTGYPDGLRGEAIPIAGRLMAVVDVYDATTTRTLYLPPMSHDEAVAFIAKGSGSHFDPAVVDAFVKVAPLLRRFSEDQERELAVSSPVSARWDEQVKHV
jgi:adenylate cyclase